MDRKLSQFFEGSPVEMAPGGTHHVPWSRRLLTVLLTMGIFLASFAAPAPARADEAGNRKLLAEFQKKADSFLPKGGVLFVARKDIMEAPEKLLSRIMASCPDNGLATAGVRLGIDELQTLIKSEAESGFMKAVNATEPAAHPTPLCLITTNDPDCTAGELLSTLSQCAPETIRRPYPATSHDISRGELYHELGHAYQKHHPDLFPKSGNAAYDNQMDELHAELCNMVGMTRDTGSTDFIRTCASARALYTFQKVLLDACYTSKTPEQSIKEASTYAIGETLFTAVRLLEEKLKNPETSKALERAGEEDICRIATRIFQQTKPSEQDYKNSMAALVLLGKIATSSIQNTEHNLPSIVASYANAGNAQLASSTPQVRLRLQDFLNCAYISSQHLQKDISPPEQEMVQRIIKSTNPTAR